MEASRRIDRSGPVARLVRALTTWGASRRRPLVVSLCWVIMTRRLTRAKPRDPGERVHRLVVMFKKESGDDGLVDDLTSVLGAREHTGIELLGLSRLDLKRVFHAIAGEGLRNFNYASAGPEFDAAKAEYRDFLRAALTRYLRWMRVSGMISANVVYYSERELATACEELGGRFIVLHKESIRSDRQRRYYTDALRDHVGPFTGSAVAVYNEEERRSQIEADVARPDMVTVTGMARMDVLHRLRTQPREAVERRVVAYFAIDPVAGTKQFGPAAYTGEGHAESTPRWDRLAAATERALVSLAREHPEIRLVIKSKTERARSVTHRLASHALPDNVEVVTRGTGTPILERAHVAVGFNSTVLVEALAAGAHVVVPRFEEAGEPASEGFVFDLGDSVTWADTAEVLRTVVLDLLEVERVTTLSPQVSALLERFVGNPDGRARERVHEWMLEQLERAPSGMR